MWIQGSCSPSAACLGLAWRWRKRSAPCRLNVSAGFFFFPFLDLMGHPSISFLFLPWSPRTLQQKEGVLADGNQK